MLDPRTHLLPQSVRTSALEAIAKLHAWNRAVESARQQEVFDGCQGYYEFDLIASVNVYWTGRILGGHALDLLEESARAQGWTVEDFYAAVGQSRPVIGKEGPRVSYWDSGSR